MEAIIRTGGLTLIPAPANKSLVIEIYTKKPIWLADNCGCLCSIPVHFYVDVDSLDVRLPIYTTPGQMCCPLGNGSGLVWVALPVFRLLLSAAQPTCVLAWPGCTFICYATRKHRVISMERCDPFSMRVLSRDQRNKLNGTVALPQPKKRSSLIERDVCCRAETKERKLNVRISCPSPRFFFCLLLSKKNRFSPNEFIGEIVRNTTARSSVQLD